MPLLSRGTAVMAVLLGCFAARTVLRKWHKKMPRDEPEPSALRPSGHIAFRWSQYQADNATAGVFGWRRNRKKMTELTDITSLKQNKSHEVRALANPGGQPVAAAPLCKVLTPPGCARRLIPRRHRGPLKAASRSNGSPSTGRAARGFPVSAQRQHRRAPNLWSAPAVAVLLPPLWEIFAESNRQHFKLRGGKSLQLQRIFLSWFRRTPGDAAHPLTLYALRLRAHA